MDFCLWWLLRQGEWFMCLTPSPLFWTSPSQSGLGAHCMNRCILMTWRSWESNCAPQKTQWQVSGAPFMRLFDSRGNSWSGTVQHPCWDGTGTVFSCSFLSLLYNHLFIPNYSLPSLHFSQIGFSLQWWSESFTGICVNFQNQRVWVSQFLRSFL